jgi:DNA polymerase-3 subunit delta'
MFDNFWGNPRATEALEQMLSQERLAQTLLFAGREGVGKATLARRLGARLLGRGEQIERDDLSLPDNLETVAAREKWSADKRNEDPLLFATHSDFVTFAPDGPLRQISIQQTRLLKDRAQFLPHQGSRRIFLIDHVDRANEQAAKKRLRSAAHHPIARRTLPFRAAGGGRDAGIRSRAGLGPAGTARGAGGGQSGPGGFTRPGDVR